MSMVKGIALLTKYLPFIGRSLKVKNSVEDISFVKQTFYTRYARGHIDSVSRHNLIGWMVINKQPVSKIKVYCDGMEVDTILTVIQREDVKATMGYGLEAGFCLDFLYAIHFTQGVHTITLNDANTGLQLASIKVKCDNATPSLQSSTFITSKPFSQFFCQPDTLIEGYIDSLTHYSLSGWAVKKMGEVGHFTVYLDDKEQKTHFLPANRKDVYEANGYGFYSGFYLTFLQPLHFTGKTQKLVLKEDQTGIDLFTLTFVKTLASSKLNQINNEVNSVEQQNITSTIIDVIVPVYLGVQETLNCLYSVVQAKNNVSYKLIIINDCSPDTNIDDALRKFVKEYSNNIVIELHENIENLGFVKTVNKGMRLSKKNDVVLLNADTEVSDYWLDKFHDKLQQYSDIGTITPFSNQATIFSFPVMNPTCDYEELASIKTINNLLEKYNVNKIHDVPTAHGFCMCIRRKVLNDIGLFDEDKWDKGYCEENDFSLRASLNGWRNVVACDTYVKHLGSVSFQGESSPRIAKNLALLNQLYPFYLDEVTNFIIEDPLNKYRTPLLEDLLNNKVKRKAVQSITTKHIILHVIHSLGGGTEHAMRTLINKTKRENACSIVLRSINKGKTWRIECEDQQIVIDYSVIHDITGVCLLLNRLAITHIHYHQLLEFDNNVRLLPNILKCSYDISLHDYYLMCPKVTLLNDKDALCTGPESNKCYNCIKNTGSISNDYLNTESKVKAFFAMNHQFMQDARSNIAPTLGVKVLFTNTFDDVNIVVKAHPEQHIKRKFVSKPDTHIVNVAILGAIGEHKGSHKLAALVHFADQKKLPLRFIVIGYATQALEQIVSDRLIITGQYKLEDIPGYIQHYQCDRALFISPWPETYSYTLSEALQQGLYPFALALGAYKDRLQELNMGCLLPVTSSDAFICNNLLVIKIEQNEYEIGIEYDYITTKYYELD